MLVAAEVAEVSDAAAVAASAVAVTGVAASAAGVPEVIAEVAGAVSVPRTPFSPSSCNAVSIASTSTLRRPVARSLRSAPRSASAADFAWRVGAAALEVAAPCTA